MRWMGLMLCAWVAAAPSADTPFEAPQGLQVFARQAVATQPSVRPQLQALLQAVFQPVDQGGLGMVYDNTYTRSVEEVWRDHRANCLSLTAFYVAACRNLGLDARFAEVMNANRWRRTASTIRFERHVVALVRVSPHEELVADFFPTTRRRMGHHMVEIIPREEMLALFHSNRAVEYLEAGNKEAALAQARISLEVGPRSSVAWNVQGVVLNHVGRVQEAEAAFRKALTLNAKDGAALGNLEVLLRDSGRLEEAAWCREKGNEIRKKDPYFHYFLAGEAQAAGDLEDARKHIRTAIKLQPHDPEFFLLEAQVFMAQGKPDKAIKALKTAKKLSSPSEQSRFENKLAILEQGRQGKPR